jgi:hypothetical protein
MMLPRTVMILSIAGIAIGGADGYWQIHSGSALDIKFWVGMAFGTLGPVGSYLVGLAQKAPWDAPKQP